MIVVALGQFVLAADKKPLISDPIVEKAIRSKYSLNKPTGELTKADLAKVTRLNLSFNSLTEVPKELEKLTQLTWLLLFNNPDLTKAQIAVLKKALPKCRINSNPKKQLNPPRETP